MKDFLIGVLFVLAVAGSFLLGRRCPTGGAGGAQTPKVDTLYISDTSTFVEPPHEPSGDVVVKEIPVPVFVADSSAIDSLLSACAKMERRGDSLQLVLLRVQRHYRDSTYDAWVSGVDPKLDSIKVYRRDMVITKEIPVIQETKTRWGLGVNAGVGMGREGLMPYVGVGISYNILSW